MIPFWADGSPVASFGGLSEQPAQPGAGSAIQHQRERVPPLLCVILALYLVHATKDTPTSYSYSSYSITAPLIFSSESHVPDIAGVAMIRYPYWLLSTTPDASFISTESYSGIPDDRASAKCT